MIAICTPARDTVHAAYANDLAQLLLAQKPGAVMYGNALGSILQNNREALVRAALERNATHVLFIDSDMRFPADTVSRLMQRRRAMVGANCAQRTGALPTARVGGKWLSSVGKTGCDEVETLGFGVTLVDLSVVRAMPEPWFEMPWDGVAKKFVGEDVRFCQRVREAGGSVWVDHDLSQHVRHIGSVELDVR